MSGRLPSVRARDVIRALERAGFAVSRTSGSHCRLAHTSDPTRKVTIPLHGNTDLKRGTSRSIIAGSLDLDRIHRSAINILDFSNG